MLDALNAVESLGGTYLYGCIAYELGRLTGKPPTAQERAGVVETLRDVAEEAQKRGITLGFECVNRSRLTSAKDLALDDDSSVRAQLPRFAARAAFQPVEQAISP